MRPDRAKTSPTDIRRTKMIGFFVYSTRTTETAVKPLLMKFIDPEARDRYSAGNNI